MTGPVFRPSSLSTEQAQAMVAHLFKMSELMWQSHSLYLGAVVESGNLSADLQRILELYSSHMNDIMGLQLIGIQEILNRDIGEPPVGGMQ
jgi:hypothetical protein